MMFNSETLFENDTTMYDYTSSDDDDDDQDDSEEDSDSDQDEDTEDHEDEGDVIAGASNHEVNAHRNMLGEVMQHLADNGIDVDELAENAGIDSSDVDALSHDDLATLTQYVSQNHPDIVQDVASRFPAAQGILGALTGGGGGILGKLFGR